MKKSSYLILPVVLSFCLLIIGCGSLSSPPSSHVGYSESDIIHKYNFHIEGEPTITAITLPQQFTGANWGLKEILCQQAGYELTPYAGQSITLIKYSITEKYYHPNIPESSGEPLYLYILAKDQISIGGYLAVRENSLLTPGGFALNDTYIK